MESWRLNSMILKNQKMQTQASRNPQVLLTACNFFMKLHLKNTLS